MCNTIHKYIIVTFSIANDPYPCHPYIFITENYFLKFTIMSFWAPVPRYPAESSIAKNILDTSLRRYLFSCYVDF